MQELYGYVDFLKLCHVSDATDYFGYNVKCDGVWKIPPDDRKYRLSTASELDEEFLDFKDFSRPVLSFPCTRDQLRDFLRKTSLDCNVDPASEVLLDRTLQETRSHEVQASGKWYTITQAAQILGMSEDEVFRRMIDPDGDEILFPSVYFKNPVKMKRIGDGYEAALQGLFEIEGAYERHLWDRGDLLALNFGGKSKLLLHQAGNTYIVTELKKIRKSNLVVSTDELEHYTVTIGLEAELPAEEDERQLVARMQAKGRAKEEIAKALKNRFPRITQYRIGFLLPANPGTYVSPEACRKQGQRLLEKLKGN